ncbi:MAG: response regulator [Candidatus Margulisbacteria bacterium]|nr:response regulator [Candidatus Margulisiibacteriota bacterium]
MANEVKILVVDDDLSVLESFKMILGIKDYYVKTAKNLEEAVAAAKAEKFNAAFIDLRFEGQEIGLDILTKLKEIDPAIGCVICTAYASEKSKISAVERGAIDYISKPFMMEVIYELIDRALEKKSGKK